MPVTALVAVLTVATAVPPAVRLLGYDPETPVYAECQTRQATARLVTVALRSNKPLPERLTTYFSLAGLYGAANAACPANHARLALPKGPVAGLVWDAPTCAAAAEAVWAPALKAQVEDTKLKAHPDVAAGFAETLADAIAPIRAACDPHPAFAKLEVAIRAYRSDARSMRSLRGCLLWRAAANREYDTAKRLGESRGRSAGLAHLNGPGMIATAQSKLVCEAASKASGLVDQSAFQVMMMSLAKTVIEAMPETPSRR
jgi:hypothetical protein